ncbi:uncharacterized protein HaLaN_01754 [Haematococcus lacustris]|uniref:Uncharacterized protein n=1 Tax=Haematococcus lacustris TaxID=44745 RepID=A0A699YCC0_HAELA|nr:uncharacterized protein HaLaN_01754 [Haematococcus lacustris]
MIATITRLVATATCTLTRTVVRVSKFSFASACTLHHAHPPLQHAAQLVFTFCRAHPPASGCGNCWRGETDRFVVPAAHSSSPFTIFKCRAIEQSLPHVRDCYFCTTCYLTQDRDAAARPQELGPDVLNGPASELSQQIVPAEADIQIKQQKPNCTECWGCSTKIDVLRQSHAFGHTFAMEIGATSEWLFYADLPDTHVTGRRAVVKVWCLPYEKV